MGLHLPPKSTLDTIPVSRIQKFMRREVFLGSSADDKDSPPPILFALDDRALSRKGGLEEMSLIVDKGMARFHHVSRDARRKTQTPIFSLTPEGEALMFARLRNRVSLPKADAAFGDLKNGIGKLNKSGIARVTEVWIFGSYMRREQRVGDIDAAILIARTGSVEETEKRISALHGDEPWHAAAIQRSRWASDAYEHRMIFGGRRRAMFDGAKIGGRDLRAGMPIQRVYTAAGGWQAEGVLDLHPEATGPLDKPHARVTIDQGVFDTRNMEHSSSGGSRNPHLTYDERSPGEIDDRATRAKRAAQMKATRAKQSPLRRKDIINQGRS